MGSQTYHEIVLLFFQKNLHNFIQVIVWQILNTDLRSAFKTAYSGMRLIANGHFDKPSDGKVPRQWGVTGKLWPLVTRFRMPFGNFGFHSYNQRSKLYRSPRVSFQSSMGSKIPSLVRRLYVAKFPLRKSASGLCKSSLLQQLPLVLRQSAPFFRTTHPFWE